MKERDWVHILNFRILKCHQDVVLRRKTSALGSSDTYNPHDYTKGNRKVGDYFRWECRETNEFLNIYYIHLETYIDIFNIKCHIIKRSILFLHHKFLSSDNNESFYRISSKKKELNCININSFKYIHIYWLIHIVFALRRHC